jgi:Holliday junction DNA helicase RuvA
LDVLTAAPGVGKKLAERLAVELSDKAQGLAVGEAEGPAPQNLDSAPAEKAALALQSLGYGPAPARLAVQEALAELGPQAKVESLVRAALKVAR